MEIIICVIVAALILFAIYEIYELNTIKITRNEIEFKNLPKEFNGYKILQISDLHSKLFGKNNNYLISKIDEVNPDVIFMTGDIVDRYTARFKIIEEFLSTLSKKYKIYYSFGNNELSLNEKKFLRLKNILQKNNIILLDNEVSKLYKNGEYIEIHGMNYIGENRKIKFSEVYDISKINSKSFNISLLHNPDENVLYKDIDLFFCGHNHGGMINLGKVGFFGPSRKFFIKYISGVYDISKRGKMVVSRGLGEGRAIIRINNLPDLTYTILKSQN